MKEMDRIAIKKIERVADAEYKEYLDSLSDEMREEYLSKISDEIKRDVRINSFDSYITRYYEDMKGCPHEYAICNGKDTFCDKDCLCLDCGEYVDKSETKKVIYSCVDASLSEIRKKYIELLMHNSVSDAYVKTFKYFGKNRTNLL